MTLDLAGHNCAGHERALRAGFSGSRHVSLKRRRVRRSAKSEGGGRESGSFLHERDADAFLRRINIEDLERTRRNLPPPISPSLQRDRSGRT